MGYPLLSGESPITNWTGMHKFYAKVNFGSASVASVQTREIAITRVSAGRYQVQLPTTYRMLCDVSAMLVDPVGAMLLPVVQSETVATDGKVVIELRTEAGVATDPDSGAALFVGVTVSSEPFNDATV